MGPGQSPGGVQGEKPLEAPGISHFLVAENGLKYQKILQFTVLQKRPKLRFQCNVSFLSRSQEISAGLRKKCDGFSFILAGLLVQWRGFKDFSGSLKSCQKVERVRSENSAGLVSAGVLLRGVMFRTNNDCATPLSCKQNNALLSLW